MNTENSKTELIQVAKSNGTFVLINPSSIASIDQIGNTIVRITMKEIKEGQSIFFDCNYSLDALRNPVHGLFRDYTI